MGSSLLHRRVYMRQAYAIAAWGEIIYRVDGCLAVPQCRYLFFCVFDGKFNTFRSHITICRLCFCHLVFLSYDKALDDMCFLFGYPFIHRISILICYL